MRQALRQALAIGLAFACLASLSMFYEFYLRWYGRFENGRYFDPVESVVYHDGRGLVWGALALVFGALCAATLLIGRRG